MKLLLAIVVCALFTGCRSFGNAGGGIPFRTIARGTESGLEGDDMEVARSEEEWRALWNRHTSTFSSRPDLPAIDFAHEMVICVLMGPQPTAGYEIEVAHIEIKNGGYFLRAFGTTPEYGAVMTPVVSHPYHMIAVPRRDGNVTVRTETHGPDTP
jgi:hypothetical protein